MKSYIHCMRVIRSGRRATVLGLLGVWLVTTGCAGLDHRQQAQYDDLIWIPVSLKTQADSGDPEAQHAMGLRCEQASDDEKAAAWYRMAAEQGHAGAQNNLGLLYFTGRGVQHDPSRALELYESAARQNDPSGIANLGIMYLFGHEVEVDRDRALQLLEAAAKLDNPRAQYLTAVLLLDRKPVLESEHPSIRWLEAAAEKGLESARRRLALLRERESGASGEITSHESLAYGRAD